MAVTLNNNVKYCSSQYPDWEWDHFNATVPMSTYIICVIVSDFAAETADPAIFPGKPVKV